MSTKPAMPAYRKFKWVKVPDVMTSILKRGKTLDGYSILNELAIDPGEIEAVKLVNNQLESLRRFGLVEETAIILHRWIVARETHNEKGIKALFINNE